MRTSIHNYTFAACCCLSIVSACGEELPPANQLTGVRILATRADLPYARPGETVTLTTLAVDARADRTRPMRVSYFPTLCLNPPEDDPVYCFPALRTGLAPRSNVDARFTAGDSLSFVVPADVIATHSPPRGGPEYGVGYAFVVACAGHLEVLPESASYPTAQPFGCFDDAGVQLGKEDFVFAYARVYAFNELRNTNPALDGITLDGTAVDEKVGVELARCTAGKDDSCTKAYLDALAAPATQELDPTASTPQLAFREQVWISYFVTAGKMESDLSVIYDAREGKLPKTRNALTTRAASGDYLLYAILRDSRGGVAWKTYPFKIR